MEEFKLLSIFKACDGQVNFAIYLLSRGRKRSQMRGIQHNLSVFYLALDHFLLFDKCIVLLSILIWVSPYTIVPCQISCLDSYTYVFQMLRSMVPNTFRCLFVQVSDSLSSLFVILYEFISHIRRIVWCVSWLVPVVPVVLKASGPISIMMSCSLTTVGSPANLYWSLYGGMSIYIYAFILVIDRSYFFR